MTQAEWSLSVGHLVYVTPFSIRFSHLDGSITVMVVVSVVQLINPALWLAGLDSTALYAIRSPVFLGCWADSHGVMGALALVWSFLCDEEQGYLLWPSLKT